MVLLEIGKSKDKAIISLVEEYKKRLQKYCQFEIITIREAGLPKSARPEDYKVIEGEKLQKVIGDNDQVVLLDEKGKEFNSRQFAGFVHQQMSTPKSRLVFVIGGAYGFDDSIYLRSNEKLSMSKMTYSHQIIRPIFMEQLYRAFTILNNHPYHND